MGIDTSNFLNLINLPLTEFFQYCWVWVGLKLAYFYLSLGVTLTKFWAFIFSKYVYYYSMVHYNGRFLIFVSVVLWRSLSYFYTRDSYGSTLSMKEFFKRRFYFERFSLFMINFYLIAIFSFPVNYTDYFSFFLLLILFLYNAIIHIIAVLLAARLTEIHRCSPHFGIWDLFQTKRSVSLPRLKLRIHNLHLSLTVSYNSVLSKLGLETYTKELPKLEFTEDEQWSFDPKYEDQGTLLWLFWLTGLKFVHLDDIKNLVKLAGNEHQISAINANTFYTYSLVELKYKFQLITILSLISKNSLISSIKKQKNFSNSILKKLATYQSSYDLKEIYKYLINRDIRKILKQDFLTTGVMLPSIIKVKFNFSDFFIKHLVIIYTFFKTTIVALLLTLLYFVYTVFFFKIQFLKQLAIWFIVGMLYFWLISGFNFFIKRYQYGKFTSQIQRFWKRTNTCFWLIEGFLMGLFFFYFLNSSQEPLYMYDYSALNQEYLISLQVIGLNVIVLSIVIYTMYYTMLRLNSNNWQQISTLLIIVSVFIFFSFFVETYQFYYVISIFNEMFWSFNEEENIWMIDFDNPILRTKHQYFIICLIAKYWHFLFIFISWIFFLIKSFEKRKITLTLYGANLQNIIILYVLNFACYLQWFKWLYRRFFDLPYTWFFANIDSKFIFRFFSELYTAILSLFNVNLFSIYAPNLLYKSLYLWNVDSLAMWKYL